MFARRQEAAGNDRRRDHRGRAGRPVVQGRCTDSVRRVCRHDPERVSAVVAIELTQWKRPTYIGTPVAAYAELGQLSRALRTCLDLDRARPPWLSSKRVASH